MLFDTFVGCLPHERKQAANLSKRVEGGMIRRQMTVGLDQLSALGGEGSVSNACSVGGMPLYVRQH